MEEWRSIADYPNYEISSFGNVRNVETGRILKPEKVNGYYRIQLHKNGVPRVFRIHRLVATAFIPNPENKPFIDHKDHNRTNNMVENLRWATGHENNGNRLGVGVHKRSNKYCAAIWKDGKTLYLGTYDTEEEARKVYIAKHIEIFGPYSPYYSEPEPELSSSVPLSCSGVNLQ